MPQPLDFSNVYIYRFKILIWAIRQKFSPKLPKVENYGKVSTFYAILENNHL